MLFDQIAKKRPEGVPLLLFRQDAGNIARNRICSSGADFTADSGKLMLRQANGNLRPGHTSIIPLPERPNELSSQLRSLKSFKRRPTCEAAAQARGLGQAVYRPILQSSDWSHSRSGRRNRPENGLRRDREK